MTRFRHLLRRYAAFLDLLEDAADKQGGDYVLDRQYVVALVDGIGEAVDEVLFDLNVLTARQHLDLYPVAAARQTGLRDLLAAQGDGADAGPPETTPADPTPGRITPERLAAAIAGHEVAFRQAGVVVCRGVAAGPVRNLRAPSAPGPDGGEVIVAGRLGDEEALAPLLRHAAALLLDEGSSTSPAASLARELRVPAIVGLRDASLRLPGGSLVTVDADENTVYLGVVRELLDYYAAERIDNAEEPEYHLLRAVRRAAFTLTASRRTSGAPVESESCASPHDLVFLGHVLAGEAIARLAPLFPTAPALAVAEGLSLRVVDPLDGGEEGAVPAVSGPLAAFCAGLREGWNAAGAGPASTAAVSGLAVVKDEQAMALIPGPEGFDLVDAVASRSRALNHVYCRFDSRAGDAADAELRGLVAARVLARLGFAAAATPSGAIGWLRGRSAVEVGEALGAVGRLRTRLDRVRGENVARPEVDAEAERIARECG